MKVTLAIGIVATIPPLLQIVGLKSRSGPLHWFAAGTAAGLTLLLWSIDGMARRPDRTRTTWGRMWAAVAARRWRLLVIAIRSILTAEIVLFLWSSLTRLGLRHGVAAQVAVAILALLLPCRHVLLLRGNYAESLRWQKLGELATAMVATSLALITASIGAIYAAPTGKAYLRPATPGVAFVWIAAVLVIMLIWLVALERLMQPRTRAVRRRRPGTRPPVEY
ncbi:MAG TPA: hypothetical protein EYP62_01530 [Kiritimatiellae bacterium]|nr:hypothetical protein [Kiritimatiellia bacterium]